MERAGDGGKKSQAPTFAGCVTKLQHKTIFSKEKWQAFRSAYYLKRGLTGDGGKCRAKTGKYQKFYYPCRLQHEANSRNNEPPPPPAVVGRQPRSQVLSPTLGTRLVGPFNCQQKNRSHYKHLRILAPLQKCEMDFRNAIWSALLSLTSKRFSWARSDMSPLRLQAVPKPLTKMYNPRPRHMLYL